MDADRKEYQRKYYKANKDKRREYFKEYYFYDNTYLYIEQILSQLFDF